MDIGLRRMVYKDAAFTVPLMPSKQSQAISFSAKWSSRKPANWEVRYVDAMGVNLARSIRGTDNLYDVLTRKR